MNMGLSEISLASLMICPALIAGCVSERRVTFDVQDAASQKPVAGAKVGVFYKHVLDFFPRSAEGTTNAQGAVTLPVVANDVASLQVESPGYRNFYADLTPKRTIINSANGTASIQSDSEKSSRLGVLVRLKKK